MTGSVTTLLVNNSNDTFTPTASGAIATCLWNLLRATGPADGTRWVLTRDHPDAPYDWADLATCSPTRDGAFLGRRGERAVRRLTGWAHPEQRSFARAALATARRTGARRIVCNNDPEIAVYLSRRLPGVEVVHWFHNLEVASDRPRRAYVALRRIRSVAVSRYLARAVETVYKMETGQVDVAHNGVDSATFTPEPRLAARGGDAAAPTVAFLGRVAVEKGTDVFLQALSVLHERGVSPRVLVIGDTNWGRNDGGPYGTLVARMAEDLTARGLEVTRTGHVARERLPAVLREADIQVLSSRWDEPCALTILEGMATGLAMVATSTGGTPELVGDAGLLVPREDPPATADAIERLLADPALRARLGATARARAESFTWARTWERIVGEGSPPGTPADATNPHTETGP